MTGLWMISLCCFYILLILLLNKTALSLFKRYDWTCVNFQGEQIIQSFGLVIPIHYFLFLVFFYIGQQVGVHNFYATSNHQFIVMVLIFSLTMIGWVDDHYGTKEVKGIRGHVRLFLQDHKMTSGLFKAILGSILAILVSYHYSPHFGLWIVNSLLLVFSIHIMNLLDVRPGRSIKGFWILLIVVSPFFQAAEWIQLILPSLIISLSLFHYDRIRAAMLGDTGSNVLGGLAGYLMMISLSLEWKLLLLLLFVGLSVYSEKRSFTQFISQRPWLAAIDQWGIRLK